MSKSRRRMSWMAGAAAALVLSAPGAMWLLRSADATAGPSLPRHLSGPGLFTPDGRRSPAGAASVAFSGQHSLTDDEDQYTVTVAGARTDTYRSLPVSSIAGISAILSPDGKRLAVQDGIVNLSTGAVTRLPSSGGDVNPEAWSPDGRYLATMEYAYSDGMMPKLVAATFSVVDTSNGHAAVFGDAEDANIYDGWVAAFSPDDQIAYQVGTSIHIAGPTGAQIRTLAVAVGSRIAGKGAWTPDGNGLTVVSESACHCGQRWDARWTLHMITIATGEEAGASYTVGGVIAVRMLGWAGSRPVVQTFEPGPHGLDEPSDHIVDFQPLDPAANDGYDYMNEVETSTRCTGHAYSC